MINKFKFMLLSSSVLLIFACTQTQLKTQLEQNAAVNQFDAKNNHESEKHVEQLTFHGNNSQPSYSPDGSAFVYVSKERYSHSNSQVYQYDFQKKEENRIIFQDGMSSAPIYSDFGKSIIFASTTDEIKENPMYLYNKLYSMNVSSSRGIASTSIIQSDELHAYELYKKTLLTDDFIRLTHSKKLDNNMSYYRKNSSRLFTSVRNGNLDIYKYRPRTPHSPVRLTFSSFIDDEAEISPISNDYVWVRYGQQSQYSQILSSNLYKKDKTELTFGSYFNTNPAWHPKGDFIYYSATNESHKNFQLYVMNKNGTCKTRITYNKFNDTQPSLDPQLSSIIFTRAKNDKQQIFKTKLREPACQTDT